MKTKKEYSYKIGMAICLLALSLLPACKKFLEIAPPTSQLITASVFNNNGAATSAMTAIYQKMYSNDESFLISQAGGLLSDEFTNYSTENGQVQFYTNAMTAVNGPGEWIRAYNYIYQANAIIAALTNNSAISPSVSRQLTGEAEFIRAFWHFYLTNCYGDVPLVTTINYKVSATLNRTPQAQVYQQVIADLKDAQGLLNSNFVDASDTTITTQRVRPTKWAATALLAKVYLYIKDYTDAATQASAVIGNSSLFSLDALNGVFLANSTEAIWQLYTPLPASYNTIDGYGYILTAAPSSGSLQCVTLSPNLLNSFESGDKRLTNWVSSISFGSKVYSFPFKYEVQSGGTTISEYTMVLRLGEQYLIRAEAEAYSSGGTAQAVADLNVIRNRAGLPAYAGATDQNSVLAAILHERQVEMFTEWGNRWFDVVRTGNVNQVMGTPGNVTQAKGGTWKTTDSLYPIPQSEISADPNLSQNAGY